MLGTVEVKGRRLSLAAHSPARAERGRALLEPVLAGLVRAPFTERTDLDQMLADRPAPAPTGLSPKQEREVVHQGLDAHYRRVLDEPIPALGGKTPRAAARTTKGRVAVVAWLKTLENHSGRENLGTPWPTMISAGCGGSWVSRRCGIEPPPLAHRAPAPKHPPAGAPFRG